MIVWHFCIACGKPTNSKIPRCEECQKEVEEKRRKMRQIFGLPIRKDNDADGKA